jgi:hypothetical protein
LEGQGSRQMQVLHVVGNSGSMLDMEATCNSMGYATMAPMICARSARRCWIICFCNAYIVEKFSSKPLRWVGWQQLAPTAEDELVD